jgi:hypothetical protein
MITSHVFRRGRHWVAALLLALGLSAAVLSVPHLLDRFAQTNIDSMMLAGPTVDPRGGGG